MPKFFKNLIWFSIENKIEGRITRRILMLLEKLECDGRLLPRSQSSPDVQEDSESTAGLGRDEDSPLTS